MVFGWLMGLVTSKKTVGEGEGGAWVARKEEESDLRDGGR